jgi:hypothetical protein
MATTYQNRCGVEKNRSGLARLCPKTTAGNKHYLVMFVSYFLLGGWRTGLFFRRKTGQSAKSRWRADWVIPGNVYLRSEHSTGRIGF